MWAVCDLFSIKYPAPRWRLELRGLRMGVRALLEEHQIIVIYVTAATESCNPGCLQKDNRSRPDTFKVFPVCYSFTLSLTSQAPKAEEEFIMQKYLIKKILSIDTVVFCKLRWLLFGFSI